MPGREGDVQPFYFGAELNGRQANIDGRIPYGPTPGPWLGRTTTVGSYERGFPHPWGLCDMHGNVWEFCDTDRSIPKGHRVIRGGCFGGGNDARAAKRDFPASDIKYLNLGFRVCYRVN